MQGGILYFSGNVFHLGQKSLKLEVDLGKFFATLCELQAARNVIHNAPSMEYVLRSLSEAFLS